jgi:hypothetical protein
MEARKTEYARYRKDKYGMETRINLHRPLRMVLFYYGEERHRAEPASSLLSRQPTRSPDGNLQKDHKTYFHIEWL